VTDQLPVDLGSIVANLLQQQTAMLQQQTALLQVHGESVRLQQMLVERLLGNVADNEFFGLARRPEPLAVSGASSSTSIPPATQTPVVPAPQEAPLQAESKSELSDVSPPPVTTELSSPPIVDGDLPRAMTTNPGDGANAAYAARYYRAPPAPTFAPVQPQDLGRLGSEGLNGVVKFFRLLIGADSGGWSR
jgi:hypothetical protein